MKLFNIKGMNVLIIGCGRLGASLANSLSDQNKDVTIIDRNKESFRKLSPSFGGLTIEGDGMDIKLLLECMIEDVDVVIAATDNDNINIMVGQIAHSTFKVNKVILRLYDPEKECIYKNSNIQTIFPALLSTWEVERILGGEGA